MSSIFQLQIQIGGRSAQFFLTSCSFPVRLCPLLLANAYIQSLFINDLTDTFLKTNLMRFWHKNFSNLNARIYNLYLTRVENIPIDSNLINPSVFERLQQINIWGFVSSVSNDLIESIATLKYISFSSMYFRKLVHHAGIDWIRGRVNVDLESATEIKQNIGKSVFVTLTCQADMQEEPLKRIFPDEDFCLYTGYPFRQLVFLMQICDNEKLINMIKKLNPELGCTYLWINHHASILENNSNFVYEGRQNLHMITESESYKHMGR